MKHAKLIAIAVLGMAFLGAGAVSASPVRPDDGKAPVSAKAAKHTGKKHHKHAAKKQSGKTTKHHAKKTKPASTPA